MAVYASAGAGAAAAAAAAKRRREQEEAELTEYKSEDLAGGWEFKILRSATGAFRNPQFMKSALDEEAHAGWVLVEKFDNSRLRLKRPATARAGDEKLDFDAYRTHIGLTENKLALIVAACIGGGILLITLIVAVAS